MAKYSRKDLHHGVVDFKFVGDVGLGAEVIAGEAADAGFRGEEDVGAEKGFLKFVELGRGHDDVRSDAAAAGDLAAAVGELDLRGMVGDFAFVVILVERNDCCSRAGSGGRWGCSNGRW